jgi:superfamily I DNA/RNA helicase
MCVELLDKEIDLRNHYSKKFQFILVDEFQDTSTLQMDWLKLMMDKDDENQTIRNCFMAVVSFVLILLKNSKVF